MQSKKPEFKLGLQWSFVCLLAVNVLAGCKRGNDSTVKTLDQFAGGKSRYQCSGPHAENESYRAYFHGIKTKQQSDAVQKALSAVSPEIKDRVFLGPIAAYVELTSKISEMCRDSETVKANRLNLSTVLSCVAIKDGKALIYVDDKPESISSSLVRGLAYYFIHIDGNVDVAATNADRVVVGFTDLGDFSSNKRIQGALVFLDEVPRKDVFKHLLPSAVLNSKTKSERDAAFLDPSRNFVGDRDAFVRYFAAELLDSTLCSDKSREAFAKSFPKTAKFFGADVVAENAVAESDETFSLASQGRGSSTNRYGTVSRGIPQDQAVGIFSSGLYRHYLGQNVGWAINNVKQAGKWVVDTGKWVGETGKAVVDGVAADVRVVNNHVRNYFGQKIMGTPQNPSTGSRIDSKPAHVPTYPSANPRPISQELSRYPQGGRIDWHKSLDEWQKNMKTPADDPLLKIPVVPRPQSAGAPSGFVKSDRRMEFWTPDAKENTGRSAEIYVASDGKSEVWQGEDGRWRQAPSGSGERTVKVLDRSPLGAQSGGGGSSSGGGAGGGW
jgi:hypothetical protein